MKLSILIAGALCMGVAACASPNEGNPDGDAYIGTPGSTYDMAANPPRINGVVSYDPNAPLPPSPPAMGLGDSAMPPGAPAAGMPAPR
jgi:hypothetical protein